MANHSVRLPMRNRTGPQRPKINGDENATSRHVRQSSSVAIQGVSRLPHAAVAAAKTGPQRPALSEVTTTAVNRKENVNKFNGNGKEKEVAEVGTKRTRSSAAVVAGPQRVPLNSTRAGPVAPTVTSVHTRSSSIRVQRPHVPARVAHRVPVPVPQEYLPPMATEDLDGEDDDMDIEEQQIVVQSSSADQMNSLDAEQEVNMEAAGYDEDLELEVGDFVAKSQRVWPEVNTERAERYRREVDEIRESFDDPVDEYDMTMVSEYSEEIFEYMTELEEDVMPNPDYMDGQSEITWAMRQTLVDWLLQVHLRYHMLPETLWTAVNIVDRFLSKRVVYILKLQLVGVIAMFIAAKYEEILAPSVDEFVYMTENGYTKEEILKGERIVLQTLDFKISHYCSPYSWMRKISKADDYDIQTRTLSKFLTEVTLLDHRFLRVKPSLVAAIGMYTARRMLGGDWNDAFVFYSGFTEEHLFPGHQLLIDKLTEAGFTKQHVCQKYANKKFLKASLYAIEWARSHIEDDLPREMNVEA
ncbi:uncharacterized protein FIBRA_06484 [Fibroporia radiculosa]|uniref:Uncharacterized protein n=1 Tax=Fibroporia radiculosa TaxID=599839 RepID=J4GBM2_9APHY|nr:uncharacterized protein FIBRA_06484 [Fibroporia radiculosa]CCM04313.1 predicted protein [Fibroporia radiculosa]